MHCPGPVLIFRGVRDRAWNLSALLVAPAASEPEPLRTETETVAPRRLAGRRGRDLWRYDFALPLAGEAGARTYRIGDRAYPVRLPGEDGRLRIAFTACNGSEEGNRWETSRERNAGWLNLAREHSRDPFHLLLQGGDQLYADTIWRKVQALGEWRRLPWRRRRSRPLPPDVEAAVGDYYFEEYCWLWSQPELAPLVASIPSLMMWDDHDIFDGWGSYAPEWQEMPAFQGIWRQAREHFALFQLGARPDDLPDGFQDRRGGHFGWAYRIGDIGVVAPDLRSERSRRQVMGEAGWRALLAALDVMRGCRHVLFVSTVPLVNAHLSVMERFFAWLPGHQTWQDDLVDQWPSLAHWEEWARLLRELVAFSARERASVTALSGEIHLGALGLIESDGIRIHQLTSSGIVHPPPSARLVAGLEWASARRLQVAPGLTAESLTFPGLDQRYLRARNWLSLELDAGGGLQAAWHAEDRDTPHRLAVPARPNG